MTQTLPRCTDAAVYERASELADAYFRLKRIPVLAGEKRGWNAARDGKEYVDQHDFAAGWTAWRMACGERR